LFAVAHALLLLYKQRACHYFNILILWDNFFNRLMNPRKSHAMLQKSIGYSRLKIRKP